MNDLFPTIQPSSPEPTSTAEAKPRETPARREPVTKCPVCGSAVDAEAYHCPHCGSDYCYHCRAQVHPGDPRLECVNQDCSYYGKLVCALCDRDHEKEEDPAIYSEPEDGYWPGWLIVSLVLFGYLWYRLGFGWAAVIAVVVYWLGGRLLHRLGVNIFGRTREVRFRRRSTYHTCLCCGETARRVAEKP